MPKKYEDNSLLYFNSWKDEFESRIFSIEQKQKVIGNVIDGLVHDIIGLKSKTNSCGSKAGGRRGRGNHRGSTRRR